MCSILGFAAALMLKRHHVHRRRRRRRRLDGCLCPSLLFTLQTIDFWIVWCFSAMYDMHEKCGGDFYRFVCGQSYRLKNNTQTGCRVFFVYSLHRAGI